jgi:hypothetical protein
MSPLVKLLLGASALLSMAIPGATIASAAGDGKRIEVILSGLPNKMKIRSYQRLKELAGASTMRRLEMTRSELWSIEASRLPALKAAAKRYQVEVMRVGTGAMSMLEPMQGASTMKGAQAAMMTRAMSSPAVMGMTMMSTPAPAMMEHALTAGMEASPGEAPPTSLVLPLDSDVSVIVRRVRVEITKGGCIWHGVIDATGEPVTLMWWAGGRLSGSISHGGRMYNIRHMGADMHAVVAVDPNRLPPEHAPTAAMRKSGGDMRADPLVRTGEAVMMRPERQARAATINRRSGTEAADARVPGASGIATRAVAALEGTAAIVPPPEVAQDEVVIDLVVAYTKAAASRYNDITRDLISLAVEEANQSFRNSGLANVKLRLVHAYETGYVEKGEHFDHLWRLADKGDGVMEEIHRLRNEKRADVALLVVHDPIGCGLATRVAADADEAFAVIHHECAATTYTLAHEVGHIIGARHDEALDQGKTPYPFGHGYVHGKEWRTMMSYKQSCEDCPRLPVWSSPRVKVRGVPAGSAAHDNAEVIAREAKRVAGFR